MHVVYGVDMNASWHAARGVGLMNCDNFAWLSVAAGKQQDDWDMLYGLDRHRQTLHHIDMLL